MAATAAQVAELRRMIAEPTTTTYTDDTLAGYIERYPLIDEQGEKPYTLSSASPPAQVVNTDWIPTYDLHAAAADVWTEKAAGVACKFDFDGKSASQLHAQYMGMVRFHAARRTPKSATLHKWPKETRARDFPWIVNLAEDDDA